SRSATRRSTVASSTNRSAKVKARYGRRFRRRDGPPPAASHNPSAKGLRRAARADASRHAVHPTVRIRALAVLNGQQRLTQLARVGAELAAVDAPATAV